jgi:hypothetical protein
MKKQNLLLVFSLVILLGITANLSAQDLGVDPVFGDWSGYTVVDAAHWHISGDSMVTTASGLTPRLDPGNEDWQWWNYPHHCADLAVTGPDFDGTFELEAIVKMPDNTTTGYWDVCLIFDYTDEYNYNMFTLWRGTGSCFYTVINGVKAQIGAGSYELFVEQVTGINSFHKVRVLRIGNKLSAFFDNTPVISVADDALAGAGKLGVGTINDSILIDEIRAWVPPIQFSDDATWGNYANYAAVNPGAVVVDTVGTEPVIYLQSMASPRLAPGNTDWQWWLYPYHLANMAYIPTMTYGDFTLEADLFKPAAENGDANWDAGIVFGVESDYDYNVLWLYNKANGTKLTNVAGGKREDLVFCPDSLFVDNEWHTFKITRAGNVVTCYMDDVQILTLDDAKLGAQGMLGLGSVNDPANFDNITVTGTATTVKTGNTLEAITIGNLVGDQILDVFPLTGVTADMMVAAATVSEGATAAVVNDTMGLVSGSTDVTNGMFLAVTAENGVARYYEIILYVLSSDKDISWFGLGDISATNDSLLGIFEGTKVVTLKENISIHDSATMIITDAANAELADDVELVTGMKVKVTSEDGHSKTYIIVVQPAPWPTLTIKKVDDTDRPVIDEFFDDWADFEVIDIDQYDTEGVEGDVLPMPTASDLTVYFKSVWDEEGLYMYFNFLDDIINYSSANDWERDGIEVAILVTDDAGKRANYNAWWQPELRTWEQKYTLTNGMTKMEALWPNRDMTGCDFAWYDKDGGNGWELEVFWTWAALNGNGGLYTFVPAVGKKISVEMMVNDSDEEPLRQHSLFWWQPYGTNQDASEYAMVRLGGNVIGPQGIAKIKKDLVIYPNPVETNLYFTGNEIVERAQISNVLGQVVQNHTDIRGNSINVEDLADGVYLISVVTREGRTAVARFVKQQ